MMNIHGIMPKTERWIVMENSRFKFRAWHKEAEQYCEGSTANMFSWFQDDQPVILEQYTGLKDCDGVEIYEGDVIEDDEHYYSVVSWDENDSMFVASDFGALCDYNGTKIKVIGNIHQNPELIK